MSNVCLSVQKNLYVWFDREVKRDKKKAIEYGARISSALPQQDLSIVFEDKTADVWTDGKQTNGSVN